MLRIEISIIIVFFLIPDVEIFAQDHSHAFTIADITAESNFGGPGHPDSLGGHGIMWSDVDHNGYPDLYITMNWKYNIHYPELFYSNNGRYGFTESAEEFGIADIDGGSHGAAFADLDNDGDYDLINGTTLSFAGGPEHNNVYENVNGSFVERTPACMKQIKENTRGVASFDLNRDGLLDIVCIAGWKGTGDRPDEKNEVYINKGNFNFIKATMNTVENAPAGQGVMDTDYDGDGDIDIIACNRGGKLVILSNDNDHRFSLVDPAEIGIKHTAYTGVSSGDLDNDGDLDLILIDQVDANSNDAYLYINNNNNHFMHTRTFEGIDGYTAGFSDLDHDTDLDLVFDGHPFVYLNSGDGTFREGPEIPLHDIEDPRSVAFADMDNDGDMDFAFAAKRSVNRLYRNDYTGNNNWLKVKLISPDGQAGAFGAKIYLYDVNGKLIALREAKSNYGYLAQDDQIIHFGAGAHKKVNVEVKFITGEVVELKNMKTNSTITVD